MKKGTFVAWCLLVLMMVFFSTHAMAEIIWERGALMTADDLMMSAEEGKISIGNLQVVPTMRLGGGV